MTATELQTNPFHQADYASVADAWEHGLNEHYWRHGIVIGQGNGMNVSETRARERLRFIASRLLRQLYGNNHRRKGCRVRFIVCPEGSRQSYNQHFHALMAIEGAEHSYSDFRITLAIRDIDRLFLTRHGFRGEKLIHVDYALYDGNHYHSYATKAHRSGLIF